VSLNSLSQIAEKLRAMIESSFIVVGGRRISVTVSIGAALVHEKDTLESLIERTDHLMYQSKQGGRNRVTRES
jgi:diguanylate cyclase (GGDEF)-like protein